MIIDAEADILAQAQLYLLSPQMCDVVLAAATTLNIDDLPLMAEGDLPGRSGMLVLPHPVLVRSLDGFLRDDRAYTWATPAQVVHETSHGLVELPAVRVSGTDTMCRS